MAYEYFKCQINSHKDYRLVLKKYYNKYIDQEFEFFANKIHEGYEIFFITLTVKKPLWSPFDFKEYINDVCRKFHSKLSRCIERNIFKKYEELVPILKLYVDRDKPEKKEKTKLHEYINKPHLHGFLLLNLNKDLQKVFINLKNSGKLQKIWNTITIKEDNNIPMTDICQDVDIGPIKTNLMKSVSYATKFMKKEDYSKYLPNKEIPDFIYCFDRR